MSKKSFFSSGGIRKNPAEKKLPNKTLDWEIQWFTRIGIRG